MMMMMMMMMITINLLSIYDFFVLVYRNTFCVTLNTIINMTVPNPNP